MPGTWTAIESICSSTRVLAYRVCRNWAARGISTCTEWADHGSAACSQWKDQGSNQCREWRDQGSNQCKQWADHGHNECCDWAPCSWFCDAFYWVAKWVCVAWYWVANWVCQAWYWVANWVCQAWYWVAKWVCVAWFWTLQWFCVAWQWLIHLICTGGNGGAAFLLTDGRILMNESAGGYGTHHWWTLSPGSDGSYVSSTWTRVADSNVARKYFASAVLGDGRVIVAGGEYTDASGSMQTDRSTTAEIYDPVADTWTKLPSVTGATQIGDSPCVVLPDGRLFIGEIDNSNTFFFTPGPDSWTAGPAKGSQAGEESWVLMPDNTVVTPQAFNTPNAEKYDIATNAWVTAGALPANIFENSSAEIGPGILMPDGRAFFVGANAGNTALFTSPTTWVAGPAIPNRPNDTRAQGSKDGPGSLLPGGKVLFAAAPVSGVAGDYLSPCSFFEFDGTVLDPVTGPPNADCPTYVGRLLPLPTGEVLWAREDHGDMYLYFNSEPPQDAWRPVVTSSPGAVAPGAVFTLSGQQLNGLSQAQGYGDDYEAATNYPLVRLRNVETGAITYCRTSGHSTMGVATGATTVSTQVTVPSGLAPGEYELVAVANGIPSDPPTPIRIGRGD